MAGAMNQVRQVGETAIEAVERQHWLDAIGNRLQKAVRAAFEAGGESGRRVRDFLHGTWLGHPLHPVLTDVPIGAWTSALVLDAMATERNQLSRAADAAIGIGLVGAAGAAVTGLTDWQHTADEDRRVGLTHGLLNSGAMALYITALTLRRGRSRDLGRIVAGAGFLVAITAAYLGGHLVYKKRLGVDHAERPEPWEDFVAVLPDVELREGQARSVTAHGVSIALVRRGGRIAALGERCAHLGGPLSEGAVDADAIRCPWHGSLFSLEDGRVLEGPSTYPQPCFDVRVRAGQIEVRPREVSARESAA
jgi:nitrite reductase/ring-hydroxylating ferredoxin subunit/uncharacterized membrane protein